MKLIKAKDYEDLSKKAAIIVLNDVLLNPSLRLGLATGATPLGLYKEMVHANKQFHIDFSRVATFNLDEYHPRS